MCEGFLRRRHIFSKACAAARSTKISKLKSCSFIFAAKAVFFYLFGIFLVGPEIELDSTTNELSFSCDKTRERVPLGALKMPPEEDKQEATASLAGAKETSADGAVVAFILPELEAIFTLRAYKNKESPFKLSAFTPD